MKLAFGIVIAFLDFIPFLNFIMLAITLSDWVILEVSLRIEGLNLVAEIFFVGDGDIVLYLGDSYVRGLFLLGWLHLLLDHVYATLECWCVWDEFVLGLNSINLLHFFILTQHSLLIEHGFLLFLHVRLHEFGLFDCSVDGFYFRNLYGRLLKAFRWHVGSIHVKVGAGILLFLMMLIFWDGFVYLSRIILVKLR